MVHYPIIVILLIIITIIIIIIIFIIIISCCGDGSERHAEGGRTTQKANVYLGDSWTSQPEQVLTFSLVKCH